MELTEKSLISCWYMDSDLKVWPEFESKKGHCYFSSMEKYDQAKAFIESSVGEKYKTIKEAYDAFVKGELTMKPKKAKN